MTPGLLSSLCFLSGAPLDDLNGSTAQRLNGVTTGVSAFQCMAGMSPFVLNGTIMGRSELEGRVERSLGLRTAGHALETRGFLRGGAGTESHRGERLERREKR